jgi:hypothetical protein
MPDKLRALALAAHARLQKRGTHAPVGEILSRPEGVSRDYLASPYSPDDWELWVSLLLDTFGTRNLAVAHAFMCQLGDFCPEIFDGENRRFILNGELFQQALAIVRSLKPQNEAEAAIAVQAVAVHFCSMKVAGNIESRGFLDPKTASSLAALTKAYAAQIRTLREARGGNTKRQVIKVQKNVQLNYVRDEKHVHLPGGGCPNCDGQPYAPTRQRAHATPTASPSLPSPHTLREAMPGTGGKE